MSVLNILAAAWLVCFLAIPLWILLCPRNASMGVVHVTGSIALILFWAAVAVGFIGGILVLIRLGLLALEVIA